ncbi:DSD1 family PLP-dependent enzyme [Noviherbaspirillum cavernae]|uniref:DSD1 family PLP-dependent enzyme n=1 Tax=Noviherbaspirillum cavernae TaxID=2320862 RepID=A0A418WVY1_9BURK|nr:DSD1 family PLP-dependent enzyme [Noviherbaspirillum cavernae]RJF96749.1 DSD1 family PLP-dependent enzyme [Noviherbaspirillum cavernae]
MAPWNAATPGDAIADIDTPALILDLDAFERNLERMAQAVKGRNVRLRPHAKSHKCPEIALRQIALGAVGICCQKVSEAAVFVDAGVRDILITNEIVGAAKIRHLMELAAKAAIGVLVDHPSQVHELARAALQADTPLDVYIEVDVGAHRCGVRPGEDAVHLADLISASPPLRFAGLHCYHGSAQHLRQPQDRAAAIAGAAALSLMTKQDIEARGIAVDIVTGAGTGSFIHERDSGVYNELQPGSYVFMDRDYGDNQRGEGDVAFEHALFVLTTVMSGPAAERAVVDAGLKASSVDSGMPTVWQRPDLHYLKASDKHGVLKTDAGAALALGEKLMLVPGHCDPTVNLYDTLICVRDGKVEALWPVAARGAVL